MRIRTEVSLPAYQPSALPLGQTGSLAPFPSQSDSFSSITFLALIALISETDALPVQ